MHLEDLEIYRENGFINIDKLLLENPNLKSKIHREIRGTEDREKDWLILDDCSILLRTNVEKNSDEGVLGSGVFSIYSELLVEELAKQAGFSSAHTDLITYKGQKGILSKNVIERPEETLILYDSLITKYKGSTADEEPFINIEDIFRSSKVLSYDNVSKEQLLQLFKDIGKLFMFDVLIANPDRNPGNFGVIYNSIKKSAKLAPLFDNEMAFGGTLEEDHVAFALSSDQILTSATNSSPIIIEAPEDFSEDFEANWHTYRKIFGDTKQKPWNWETLVFYIAEEMDDTKEIFKFVSQCTKNIDISLAFKNVEDKIKTDVPGAYKFLAERIYNKRKNYIQKAIGLDLYIEEEEVEPQDEDRN